LWSLTIFFKLSNGRKGIKVPDDAGDKVRALLLFAKAKKEDLGNRERK